MPVDARGPGSRAPAEEKRGEYDEGAHYATLGKTDR